MRILMTFPLFQPDRGGTPIPLGPKARTTVVDFNDLLKLLRVCNNSSCFASTWSSDFYVPVMAMWPCGGGWPILHGNLFFCHLRNSAL